MSVLVVGMSHRSAPVSLLERLSMDETVKNDTTTKLVEQPSLSEAMIVSTCNRLEVYSHTDSFHAGVAEIIDVLAEVSGVDTETLRGYLYVRYADAAAEHMMVVASGLDSMVVGEQQIIGQVRSAYQEADEKGTIGPTLHSIAQTALHVGKRVHTETDIDEAGDSMVTFALDQAMMLTGLEDLSSRTGLVLGAGAMASLAATNLGKRGIDKLIIANRTFERAERLAEHSLEAGVPAEAVPYEDRAKYLEQVDVVVSATGADGFTIEAADIPASARERGLIVMDLSLPRDIDDSIGQMEGVTLVNIESMHEAMTSRDSSSPAHREAQRIVADGLRDYQSQQRVQDVVPALTEMRKRANRVVEAEFERLSAKLPDLKPRELEEVRKTLRRLVNEVLHTPTVRAKQLAAEEGTVTYGTALARLFGVDNEDSPGTSVSVDAVDLPTLDQTVSGMTTYTPPKGR